MTLTGCQGARRGEGGQGAGELRVGEPAAEDGPPQEQVRGGDQETGSRGPETAAGQWFMMCVQPFFLEEDMSSTIKPQAIN